MKLPTTLRSVFGFTVFGAGLMACGGSSCPDPNDPNAVVDPLTQASCAESSGLTSAQAASASLTNALAFNNPGTAKIQGAFPGDTSDATPTGQLSLSPGGSSTITTVATHPSDPDDPVVASLVWMAGSDSFISLPSAGADNNADGLLSNEFIVDESVCDDLCNIIHDIQCYEAAQTASGVITAANLTEVLLDCSEAGSPANCPGASIPSGAGGSTWSSNPVQFCNQFCTVGVTCADTGVSAAECQADCPSNPLPQSFVTEASACLNGQGTFDCSALEGCADIFQELAERYRYE